MLSRRLREAHLRYECGVYSGAGKRIASAGLLSHGLSFSPTFAQPGNSAFRLHQNLRATLLHPSSHYPIWPSSPSFPSQLSLRPALIILLSTGTFLSTLSCTWQTKMTSLRSSRPTPRRVGLARAAPRIQHGHATQPLADQVVLVLHLLHLLSQRASALADIPATA